MRHDIIPVHLAVKSMRDSGYKDTAHAIAELVDNSIQAKANNVEIICIDKIEFLNQRKRRRIYQIGVYDNGHGMDRVTLRQALQYGNGTHLKPDMQKGMGKFGMGLPNASLSQCRRVEVWSWMKGECYYTYLDLDEIINEKLHEVPEPIKRQIPKEWEEKYIREQSSKSGTLVIWSSVDKGRWKSSKAFLHNSELLIGRMYRYFIRQNKAAIRLCSYENVGQGCENGVNKFAKANDPLYMMPDTSLPPLPEPYEHEVMFEEYSRNHLDVTLLDGSKHRVNIVFSMVKNNIRKALANINPQPGKTPPGQHASKNIGVSVIRAGRELEMNSSFTIGYNPTERWWGVEVSFPPVLDEYFGVTNNKQAATNFFQMNLDKDAEEEGMTPLEYKEVLIEEQDPRVMIYELSTMIESNLSPIRTQLGRHRKGVNAKTLKADPAETAATVATRQRQEDGHIGDSDQDEELTKEQREEAIARAMEESGFDKEEAKEIAVKHVESGLKYIFKEVPYDGPSFFSSTRRGGSILVNVNSAHPITKYLYELLEEKSEENQDTLLALKLILSAWARMEDETQNEAFKERLSDMRNDWGRIARDFIRAAKES